jgi:hypothetical protein
MGLISASPTSQLDRFVGYYESYAESHETLDKDTAFQEEVRNVARSVGTAVRDIRSGKVIQANRGISNPRPK